MLLGEVGLRWRKGGLTICYRLSLPAKEAALDLVEKYRPAPAVLEGRSQIPLSLGGVLHLVEDADVVAPGNLSNKLLDNCLIRPSLGKGAHVQ